MHNLIASSVVKICYKEYFASHTKSLHGMPMPNECLICGKGFELS